MKKIVLFLLMILLVFTSTSCMGGSGADEISIKHNQLADGSIEVIFFDSYGDEIYRFIIPAGEEERHPSYGFLSYRTYPYIPLWN